jgi:hypothetical protein
MFVVMCLGVGKELHEHWFFILIGILLGLACSAVCVRSNFVAIGKGTPSLEDLAYIYI